MAAQKSRRHRGKTKAALITSFAVDGMDVALKTWSRQIKKPRYAELYTFMHADAHRFPQAPRRRALPKTVTALKRMAALMNCEREIEGIAKDIARRFDRQHIKVIAFASFIAEITASDRRKADLAQRAIRFLIQLAREMTRQGHPVSTIELVGGSLIEQAWPAWMRVGASGHGRKSYVECHAASILAEQEGLKRLVKALKPLAREAARDPQNLIQLSLELEPGPFFILGSFDRVQNLCRMLDKHRGTPLCKLVGLNLDIPHWAFLGTVDGKLKGKSITINLVRRTRTVFRRLIHGHISDHAGGHLCDDVIGAIHKDVRKHFGPWLQLLQERMRADFGNDFPRFSGFVSNEMEACKNPAMVRESVVRSIQLGLKH